MSHFAILFLRLIAPALGVLLGLLGYTSLQKNAMGWFLLVIGVVYAAGSVIMVYLRRVYFWDAQIPGKIAVAEHGERSFWFLSGSMMLVVFLSPLEFLYFEAEEVPFGWPEAVGAGLVSLGGALFLWARRTLASSYSGQLSVRTGQPLVQRGPYRMIRHPAYTGYLMVALGLAIGYSSFWGAGALLLLLVPAVVWRIHVEDQLLSTHFGLQFQQYAAATKRLIPGIW